MSEEASAHNASSDGPLKRHHGRRYTRDELLVNATGRALDPEPYIAHLTTKFTDIYDLS